MNDEQLNSFLNELKASALTPVGVDAELEKRLITEQGKMKSRTGRMKSMTLLIVALAIAGGAGAAAIGAEVAFSRYEQPSPAQEGEVARTGSFWYGLLVHVHDHLRDLHGPSHGPAEPHSYDEQP